MARGPGPDGTGSILEGMADHHFVPQFYLREFLDPASLTTPDPWLWVAHLGAGKVARRAPHNVAKRAGYYTIPTSDPEEARTLEQIFSQMEGAARPIVRKLITGADELGGQEWADVLYFAAFLAVRTPAVRNMLEESFGDLGEMVLTMAASHPGYYAETLRKARPDLALTPDEIEESRLWALTEGAFKVRGAPVMSLAAGVEAANDTVYPIFTRMRWAIVRPKVADGFFVTSDNPVSWVDPTPRPAFYAAAQGLGMPGVEVTFPVGPRVCLFGSWNGKTGAVEVDRRTIDESNLRRVSFAAQQVYAHQEQLAQWAVELYGRHKGRPHLTD
jgi:hypothetical protein